MRAPDHDCLKRIPPGSFTCLSFRPSAPSPPPDACLPYLFCSDRCSGPQEPLHFLSPRPRRVPRGQGGTGFSPNAKLSGLAEPGLGSLPALPPHPSSPALPNRWDPGGNAQPARRQRTPASRPRAGRAGEAAARCGLRRRRPFPSRRLPGHPLQGALRSYLTTDAARCHEPKPGPTSPKMGLPTPQSTQLPQPPPPPPPAASPPLRGHTAHALANPAARWSRGTGTIDPALLGLQSETVLPQSVFPKHHVFPAQLQPPRKPLKYFS